jgi:hypothetical protein
MARTQQAAKQAMPRSTPMVDVSYPNRNTSMVESS